MFPVRRTTLGGDVFRDEYSLEFDGTNDYVDCGDAVSGISDYPFTVAGWFKGEFSGDSMIFAINDVSASSIDYKLLLRSADGEGNLRLTARESGSTKGDANTTPNNENEFNDSKWHHFAAVFINDTSRILYADGVNRADDSTDVDFIAATDSFVVGANNDGGSRSKHFGGKISEIALYSTALTASQVATLYNGREPYNHKEGIATGNLVGWWRMGDGVLDGFGTSTGLIGDEVTPTRGSELIPNGTVWTGAGDPTPATQPTGWGKPAAGEYSVIDDGGEHTTALKLEQAASPINPYITELFTTVAGKTYYYTVSYKMPSSGGATSGSIGIGTGEGSGSYASHSSLTSTSWTTLSGYFVAGDTTSWIYLQIISDADGEYMLFDEVSVYQVNGNPGIMTNMDSDDIVTDTPA